MSHIQKASVFQHIQYVTRDVKADDGILRRVDSLGQRDRDRRGEGH